LTGAAKLFADAAAEESDALNKRKQLIDAQGPIWTGEESTHDAVLRMLVDAHKPHRTGEGIKHDSADKRIQQWMRNLDMSPRDPVVATKGATADEPDDAAADAIVHPHRTKIPPHLHQPWHATYTGHNQASSATPNVKYGSWDARPKGPHELFSDLELRLKGDMDSATRKKVREKRSSARLQGRMGRARESSIDYRLGISDGDMTDVGSSAEDIDDLDESFRGNRQMRGMSVLGAKAGGASGMRAWAGLVEDRIQVSRAVGGGGCHGPEDSRIKSPRLTITECAEVRFLQQHPWPWSAACCRSRGEES